MKFITVAVVMGFLHAVDPPTVTDDGIGSTPTSDTSDSTSVMDELLAQLDKNTEKYGAQVISIDYAYPTAYTVVSMGNYNLTATPVQITMMGPPDISNITTFVVRVCTDISYGLKLTASDVVTITTILVGTDPCLTDEARALQADLRLTLEAPGQKYAKRYTYNAADWLTLGSEMAPGSTGFNTVVGYRLLPAAV